MSGYSINTAACVSAIGVTGFCTTTKQQNYIADSVYGDDWNYGASANAGTFGLGKNSAIWNIVGTPSTKNYDVYMSNFNDWTFADASYSPVTTTSVINL